MKQTQHEAFKDVSNSSISQWIDRCSGFKESKTTNIIPGGTFSEGRVKCLEPRHTHQHCDPGFAKTKTLPDKALPANHSLNTLTGDPGHYDEQFLIKNVAHKVNKR